MQPPSDPCCQSTCHAPFDLCDNAVRAGVLSRLIESAAATAPTGLTQWDMPCAPLPATRPLANAETQWRNLNHFRVLSQYTTLLGELCASHPVLTGSPVTCVLGLEWMSGLLRPLAEPSASERRGVEQFCTLVEAQGTARGEALFKLHALFPIYDRSATRMLLKEHFPGSQEYEVDVCRCMMDMNPSLGHAEWLEAFPRWRDAGLLYPMGVAALYMRDIGDWLPKSSWVHPLANSLMAWVHRVGWDKAPAYDFVQGLRAIERHWAEDTTGTNLVLGHLLDRVAILMRVKSNALTDFSLQRALDAFPRTFGAGQHEAIYHAWHHLKTCIEDAMPPSLLCAPLVRPRRATWGFHGLTLQVSDAGVVRFAETDLQAVAPGGNSEVHTHTPAFSPCCRSFQTSAKVQDVLWRLGEILLSPGVAACVRPFGQGGQPDGQALLAQMRPTLGAAPPQSFLDAMSGYESMVPPVHFTSLRQPCQLLLYRIDIPNRAIVYVGSGAEVQARSESQHHLQKLLLNSKVPPCNVGGILAAMPGVTVNEACIRAALRSFAATGLREHPSNTALVRVDANEATEATPRQTAPVVHTTLAETVACFALTTPGTVSTHRINKSCVWQEQGIDPRYAERQDANNGFRYRDWAAMHAGRAGTQQSRLAAHSIDVHALYLTAMPWDCNGATRWVHVASTAPPQNRVLVGATLRAAVESRFLHDPRMLPVAREGQTVPRGNIELYATSEHRMAIVYAPDDTESLEMIAFGLAQEG